MLTDLHAHSRYSEDAAPDAEVDAICRAAIDRGISILALTDHKDFYYRQPPMPLDIEAQQADVAACQSRYAGALKLYCGIEVGEIHADPLAGEFVAAYPFDEVIGSLHTMPPGDDEMYFLPYAEMDCQAFLHRYFDELYKMVCHGGFDILAHIDYPLRVMQLPGYDPSFDGYEDRIEPILRAIIDREIALEVNAAGLFGWQKRAGPPAFVLEMYRSLGGAMLTIGSDSHSVPHVGRGLAACVSCIQAAGFTEVVYFEKRRAHALSLPTEKEVL